MLQERVAGNLIYLVQVINEICINSDMMNIIKNQSCND